MEYEFKVNDNHGWINNIVEITNDCDKLVFAIDFNLKFLEVVDTTEFDWDGIEFSLGSKFGEVMIKTKLKTVKYFKTNKYGVEIVFITEVSNAFKTIYTKRV